MTFESIINKVEEEAKHIWTDLTPVFQTIKKDSEQLVADVSPSLKALSQDLGQAIKRDAKQIASDVEPALQSVRKDSEQIVADVSPVLKVVSHDLRDAWGEISRSIFGDMQSASSRKRTPEAIVAMRRQSHTNLSINEQEWLGESERGILTGNMEKVRRAVKEYDGDPTGFNTMVQYLEEDLQGSGLTLKADKSYFGNHVALEMSSNPDEQLVFQSNEMHVLDKHTPQSYHTGIEMIDHALVSLSSLAHPGVPVKNDQQMKELTKFALNNLESLSSSG